MPNSSTASLVIEAVTIWPPPISTRTWEVVAPFFTSTTVPLIWLRALMRMMIPIGRDPWQDYDGKTGDDKTGDHKTGDGNTGDGASAARRAEESGTAVPTNLALTARWCRILAHFDVVGIAVR